VTKQAFAEKMQDVFERAKENREEWSEEDLRIAFAKSGALEELGYEEDDISWEETLENQKRTDVHVKDDVGDFVAMFECKRPSVDITEDEHEQQLRERYVLPYKVDYGILYNGIELILYKRRGTEMTHEIRVSVDKLESRLDYIVTAIRKPDRTTTELDNVTGYMDKYDDVDERLQLTDSIAREYFYENFQLDVDSVFGRLVVNTVRLFEDRHGKSDFLESVYQFWKRSYAKELTKSQVPDDWKSLFDEAGISTGSKEDRHTFMFCLETSYALFTRLILTKSAEDYDFPGDGFSAILRRQLEGAAWDGQIPQPGYGNMSLKIIREMEGKLISSVFEEDIFYWWTEPYDEREDYIDYFRGRTAPTLGSRVLTMSFPSNACSMNSSGSRACRRKRSDGRPIPSGYSGFGRDDGGESPSFSVSSRPPPERFLVPVLVLTTRLSSSFAMANTYLRALFSPLDTFFCAPFSRLAGVLEASR